MKSSRTVIAMNESWASEMMKQVNAAMRRPCSKRNRFCFNAHGLLKNTHTHHKLPNANLIILKLPVLS